MEDTISGDEVLRHQLDQLSAEKSQLEEQLQSEKKAADDLKAELDQLSDQHKALAAENTKLLEDTISSDEVLHHQLDQLSAEKSQLEEQLQSEKKAADDLKAELDQLSDQNEALAAEKAKLLEDTIRSDEVLRHQLDQLPAEKSQTE